MTRLGSTLRAMPLSMLASSTHTVHAVTEHDARIRQQLATSRRISFVQLHGGSGLSVTAAAVAAELAARRSGRVLGVDTGSGPHNLEWHAHGGAPSDPDSTQAGGDRRRRARTGEDATAGLPRTPGGLFTLRVDAGGAPASVETWSRQLGPISRFFELVCTDWGVRAWRGDLAEVADTSHAVCIVTRAERRAAEEAIVLVDAIASAPSRPRVLVAVVDVADGRRRDAGLVLETVRAHTDAAVLGIPFERAYAAPPAAGQLHRPLRAHTRLAYTRLAASLVSPEVRG